MVTRGGAVTFFSSSTFTCFVCTTLTEIIKVHPVSPSRCQFGGQNIIRLWDFPQDMAVPDVEKASGRGAVLAGFASTGSTTKHPYLMLGIPGPFILILLAILYFVLLYVPCARSHSSMGHLAKRQRDFHGCWIGTLPLTEEIYYMCRVILHLEFATSISLAAVRSGSDLACVVGFVTTLELVGGLGGADC